MLYFKNPQKPSLTPDHHSNISQRFRMDRKKDRYQEYQSINYESNSIRNQDIKEYSLSVKPNRSNSRNSYQQVISSRNTNRPPNTNFLSINAEPSLDINKNRWFEQSQLPRRSKPMNREASVHNQWLEGGQLNSVGKRANVNQLISSQRDKSCHQIQQISTNENEDNNKQDLRQAKKLLRNNDFMGAIKYLQSYESPNLDCQFMMGLALFNLGQNEQAVSIFEMILKVTPQYRKEVHLYIASCYINMKKLEVSKHFLEKCIKAFPKYYEAHLQAATVAVKLKEFVNAEQYLNTSIALEPKKIEPHLLKADCHTYSKNYIKALQEYKLIYMNFEDIRTQLNFQIKYYYTMLKCDQVDLAHEHINKLLEDNQDSSEALFIRGKIQFKKCMFNESILSLEQVIYLNHSKKMCAKSVFQIAKAKIEQKDFYSAQHHLKRFEYYKNPNFKFFNKLKPFVEGAICLMKRKYSKAIEYFVNQQKTVGISNFLGPIFYLYKAYGHFCLNEYNQCLEEYKSITKNGQILTLGALYNLEICEGLLASKKADYPQAFLRMDNAHKLIPLRMDPFFYRACLFSQRGSMNQSSQLRKEGVLEAQVELKKAFEVQGKSANLFYVRALIKSYFHRFSSAISDLDKAIDKSEDNIIAHFYLRGLIVVNFNKGILFAQQMRLDQAIKDFSTCVHFDKNYAEGYIERAKCYQIIGKQNQAFADLKKYIQLRQDDLIVHFWAASLLFHNNAYDEALKAYLECNQTKEVQTLIVKCYLKKQEIDRAHESLSAMVKVNSSDQRLRIDYELVGVIRAILDLTKTTKSKSKSEANQRDFAQVISTCLESLERMSNMIKQNSECFGFVFSQQDYYHQRAIMCFFNKNYSQCLIELASLDCYWKEKHRQRQQQQNNSASQIINTQESESVQNEMILKSERIIQHIIAVKYNIIITHLIVQNQIQYPIRLQQQNYKDAIKQSLEIKQLIGDVVSEEINYLQDAATLAADGKQIPKFIKVMTFLMNEHSLFNFYPTVKVQFRGGQTLDCKLSISFPDIQPPNICPSFKESLIETINTSLVENKPEAPWIKREQHTIMFTDNMFYGENFNLQTEENEEKTTPKVDKKELLKQALKLDDNVENKLNKLIKAKN